MADYAGTGIQWRARQRGPCYFVASDQPYGSGQPDHGKSLLVRWSDGEITNLSDHTFATVDDPACVRLAAPGVLALLGKTAPVHPAQEDFSIRHAVVARDGNRAFVLVMNQAARLAAVDLTTGRVLFDTPVPLGGLLQLLEVDAGLPILRTAFMGVARPRWYASIHDPATGRTLYED